MCGIAGIVGCQLADLNSIDLMVERLSHRGPDSKGVWRCDNESVVLGHARLAIVDISATGHQPMASRSEQYVISYNGEIYNHLSVREKVEAHYQGYFWRGTSDTETLLACVDAFGLKAALSMVEGMFALALWDKSKKQLTLARDRMGEKPLYYCQSESNGLMFASELPALMASKLVDKQLCSVALNQYLQYGYVPDPKSIYKSVYKLEPGTYLEYSTNNNALTKEKYWNIQSIAADKAYDRDSFNEEQFAAGGLEERLLKAVKGQMLSDVPLGAFLSGGVDSSLIVAMMQAQSDVAIKTFTVGYENEAYNEADHAKAVAKHLKTDHKELIVSSQDMLNVLPKLPSIYGEPFADASAIPTYLVSSFASKDVKVALSGDAGDELFCGYNRYTFVNQYWPTIKKLPWPVRQFLQYALRVLSVDQWDSMFSMVVRLTGKSASWNNPGEKIHKGAQVLNSKTIREVYETLVSTWPNPRDILSDSNTELDAGLFESLINIGGTEIDQLMLMDQLTYLPNDILVKVDRAAMACSLETRTPFLNSEIVRSAWSMPTHYKLKNGISKYPLKDVLYKYVPQDLIERPKAGFGVPLADWFASDLHEWVQDTVKSKSIEESGILSPASIQLLLDDQFKHKKDRTQELWNILMFQTWLESVES